MYGMTLEWYPGSRPNASGGVRTGPCAGLPLGRIDRRSSYLPLPRSGFLAGRPLPGAVASPGDELRQRAEAAPLRPRRPRPEHRAGRTRPADNPDHARAWFCFQQTGQTRASRPAVLRQKQYLPRPARGGGQVLFCRGPWPGLLERLWTSLRLFRDRPTPMNEQLEQHVTRVKERHQDCRGNESATQAGLIAPLFTVLGHDIADPHACKPEYKAPAPTRPRSASPSAARPEGSSAGPTTSAPTLIRLSPRTRRSCRPPRPSACSARPGCGAGGNEAPLPPRREGAADPLGPEGREARADATGGWFA
jgi:hypothetical protein